MILAVLLLQLIGVHGADGQGVGINIDQIASIREPRGEGHFDKDIKCLVFMADGKFLGVIESCPEVAEKIGRAK
jgi:hypothetical protein